MIPFKYAIGTPNGTNLIINTMTMQIQQVEKYTSPSPNQQASYLPARLSSLT
jgi:hypothetical protein